MTRGSTSGIVTPRALFGLPGQSDNHNINAAGKTFLRGTQATGETGWVGFKTIYPGWYDGRTTHIHFKVFLSDRTVLTGQTFLPDALNEFIYTNVPDYGDRARQRMVINANDHVIERSDPGHRAFCADGGAPPLCRDADARH
jgi:protocatechuate 3,4-dioxygenase beta subunit